MKQSHYIQLPEALGFIDAAEKAYYNETPWNCHIILHLEQAGIPPLKVAKHVQEAIHRLGKYHKKHGMAFCYGWVLENAPIKGTHLHILLHRPNILPMHFMTYRWAILKRFKIRNEKDILRVKKFWSHQNYHRNINKLLSYTLKGLRKGAEQRLEDQTGIRVLKSKGEGLIYGKRIGWSR
jgi:hypothetical protein